MTNLPKGNWWDDDGACFAAETCDPASFGCDWRWVAKNWKAFAKGEPDKPMHDFYMPPEALKMTDIPDEMNRAELAAVQMEASQRRATDDLVRKVRGWLKTRAYESDIGGWTDSSDFHDARELIEDQDARIAELERKNADNATGFHFHAKLADQRYYEIKAAEARAAELEERVHYAEGTADTNINRANEAEARAEWLREALKEFVEAHSEDVEPLVFQAAYYKARAALNDTKLEPEYTQKDWERVFEAAEQAINSIKPEPTDV